MCEEKLDWSLSKVFLVIVIITVDLLCSVDKLVALC